MNFYLLETTDHTFQVISKGEYVTGNILSSGDFCTMKKTLEQLQHIPSIELEDFNRKEAIACDIASSAVENSPLLRLVKTVDVTASGNTKYFLSDDEEVEDPFDCVELSEDEYIPPDRAHAKRRLFGDSSDETSTSVSTSYSIDNLRNELFDIGKNLAVVTIRRSKVQIEVLEPIHADKYVVPLFRSTQRNEEIIPQGYIIKKKVTNHKCNSAQTSQAVVFCDTIRNEYTLTCNIELCCSKGTLVGYEKFIREPFEKYMAILSYCYPANEPSVEERSRTGECSTEEREHGNGESTSTKLRQHCCFYCGELKTCIGRHLQKVHPNEEDVKILKDLKGVEKVKALRKLRYLGDKAYNETVPREERISVRKPMLQLVSESLHCPNCDGLIARKNFSKHHLRCSNRQPDRLKRVHQIEFSELKNSVVNLNAKILQELLSDLQNDEVGNIIRSDKLIQELGIYMSKSNRTMHQMKNSRAQMRRCARLLLIMREMDPSIHDFKDCLVSNKYGLLMNATRVLCKESEGTGKFANLKYPTVALQIGPMISTLVSRLRRFYLEQENLSITSPEVQALETFSALHKSEFSVEITRDALNTANTNKFKAKKQLPKPADIQKLRDHCKKFFEDTYSSLLNNRFDFSKWKQLGQVLLCQIMVFNRRRPGEISRTLMEDYKIKKKVSQEEYESLNRLEIICADLFTMIHIKGKRGKTLSILLQPDNIKGLDLFISLREKAGIQDDNPYLFSFNNREGYLSASLSLKRFTEECGAENPESLTGTHLRKQAATMCQLFNLSENELKQMADFMGHTFDVHLNHYRMPEQTTQIINISRFLSVVGDKDVFKYRGKSWDELQPFTPPEGDDDIEDEANDGINFRDHDLEDTIPVDSQENFFTLAPCSRGESEETASVPSEIQSPVKRRRVVPQKFRNTTPKKVCKKRQQQVVASSPNSIQLLNILADPSNRKKNSLMAVKQKKKRWNSGEIEFMKEKFGEYLDNSRPLPKREHIKSVLQDNREVFQEGRSVPALYAWIQNQRSKIA